MATVQDSCKGMATDIEIKKVNEDQTVKHCLSFRR